MPCNVKFAAIDILETKGKWLRWHYWMLYLIGGNCMVAKLQSLQRTSFMRCSPFKWRRELWKLKPSMAHYWFYTEDPSTDDRLLIYFPATSSPLEYGEKNICQYAPIMISWSVAIKTVSFSPYWKVIGKCHVNVWMWANKNTHTHLAMSVVERAKNSVVV